MGMGGIGAIGRKFVHFFQTGQKQEQKNAYVNKEAREPASGGKVGRAIKTFQKFPSILNDSRKVVFSQFKPAERPAGPNEVSKAKSDLSDFLKSNPQAAKTRDYIDTTLATQFGKISKPLGRQAAADIRTAYNMTNAKDGGPKEAWGPTPAVVAFNVLFGNNDAAMWKKAAAVERPIRDFLEMVEEALLKHEDRLIGDYAKARLVGNEYVFALAKAKLNATADPDQLAFLTEVSQLISVVLDFSGDSDRIIRTLDKADVAKLRDQFVGYCSMIADPGPV